MSNWELKNQRIYQSLLEKSKDERKTTIYIHTPCIKPFLQYIFKFTT
jgi:hypothetical protein